MTFYLLAKQYGMREGLLPRDTGLERALRVLTVERLVAGGAAAFLGGLLGIAAATWVWREHAYGDLDYAQTMRLVVPSAALIAAGVQTTLAGFVSGLLRAPRLRGRRGAVAAA
jgi:hypothetical protein